MLTGNAAQEQAEWADSVLPDQACPEGDQVPAPAQGSADVLWGAHRWDQGEFRTGQARTLLVYCIGK